MAIDEGDVESSYGSPRDDHVVTLANSLGFQMQKEVLLFVMFAVATSDLGLFTAQAQSVVLGVSTIASSAASSSKIPDAESDAVGGAPVSKLTHESFPDLASDTRLGPLPPEDIKLLGSYFLPIALARWTTGHHLRFFGWANGGYTRSSTGEGLLAIEPRANRFGDTWLLNQTAFVVEKTLIPEAWSWGFRAEFYMGADAAMMHPPNGIGPSDTPRFGYDFRQAYFSIHMPILTKGGVDLKFGRQYTPVGFENAMAPYRPIYSESYAWLYSHTGSTTGAIGTIHVHPKLDVIAGVTFGVNSLFDRRGRAPSFIVRGIYWLQDDKRTKLVGTLYTGPQPTAAASGHIGQWQNSAELQLVHNVNRRLTLVSETSFGSDKRDPANKLNTSWWYGTYAMGILHLHRLLDVNTRVEWFDDADASRTGKKANYGETTAGLNFMPERAFNVRPEVRYDVASNAAFGRAGTTMLQSHQWTFAFDAMLKF